MFQLQMVLTALSSAQTEVGRNIGKFACCFIGKGTLRDYSILCGRQMVELRSLPVAKRVARSN